MAEAKSKTESKIYWGAPGWALAATGWSAASNLNDRYEAGLASLKASSQISYDLAKRAADFSQSFADAQVEGLKSLSEVRNVNDLVRANSAIATNALDLYATQARGAVDLWTRASELAARQFPANAAEPL